MNGRGGGATGAAEAGGLQDRVGRPDVPVQVSRELFDLIPELTGSELKVLLYLWRFRLGWEGQDRFLSLDEIRLGACGRDGHRRDRGTGVARPEAALRSLWTRGYVEGGPTHFRLRVALPAAVEAPEATPLRPASSRKTGAALIRLREKVFHRDGGICTRCGFDIEAEEESLRVLRAHGPAEQLRERLEQLKRAGFVTAIGLYPRTLWDLDHIVPINAGGTDELTNLRTLCTPCHKDVTADLMRRLNARRGSAS